MEKLKVLLIALLIGFTGTSWAQKKLSGVVTDVQSMPIPGVNVLVKGTATGAATDFDGNYSIKCSKGDVLVFSYLGYQTKEIAFNGQSSLNVQLEEDSSQLDEVVVIGYGAVKRTDLTGAVASLSAANITEQKKTDIGQALQGRVAGVDVRSLSNKPGAPLSIRIRGNTAVRNDDYVGRDGASDDPTVDRAKPLYVVDGVFFEDINILNPADIQQMDILKDASATAIYGSRGANGVVIITTKNGVEGKTVFTYEATMGIRSVTNEPDYFTGDEYLEFVNDAVRSEQFENLFNSGTPTVADYNNIDISALISNEIQPGSEANNAATRNYTNWRKDYQKTGIQTSHNLGMSGGANGLVYNGSIGYLSDEGVIGIEAFERYNLSVSLSKRVSDKLTVGLKTYLAFSEREEGSRELYRSTQRLPPTVNSFDDDGNIILFPDLQDDRFTNPYYDANGEWRVNTKSLDVIANVFLNYKPTDWVSFKTQFAPNIKNTRFGEYRGLFTKAARNDPSRTRAIYNSFFNTSYTWDNIADFNFDLTEGHNLKATLISSVYYNQREKSEIEVRNFDTDAYLFYNTGAGLDTPRDYNSDYVKETLASFAGRLNYNILDKYLFTFTGRYDGSSKLAPDNKWAFFPSAAFAWKVIEEDFIQNTDWLSNLKLRLSYGESGNDTSAEAYGTLAFLGNNDYLFGGNLTNGVTVSGFPNFGLGWERSKEFNVGLDLGILQNKIRLGLEVYNKKTVGSIFDRLLSPITGYADTVGNFASVRNSGVEITLNTRNIQTDNFSWTTDINFARNKNEILKLEGDLELIPYENHGVLQIGQPADAIWAYEKIGIWQLDETAEADVYNSTPGRYKFRDVNDDGVLNDEDKVVLGQLSPDWTAGMTNTFRYKNLDLSVQVYTRQGSFGHSEFNQLSVPWQGDDAKFNKVDLDYWTPNNPDSQNPALVYGANDDYYYTDFDFVKIGNIGLGYQFSQEMLDKLKMSSLRLTLDIQNPFTFTDYEGSDPETGLQNNYNGGYLTKTVLFGLKLSY
ncbi:MAG: TonB-dependent receptor [Algibacter sp.]